MAERPATPPPIVFVGGTGRSGTHVVAKLFGRHSRYRHIPSEVRFHCDPGGFPDLLAGRVSLERFLRTLRGFWWRRYRGGGRPPDILPWLALGRRARGLHKLVPEDRFEEATERFSRSFAERPEQACRRLFYDLLWPLAEEAGAEGLVEMSCDNTAQAPTLARIFPEARFIHVVRDGRDASASRVAQNRGLSYPRTRRQGIEWWERRLRRIDAALRQISPDRFLGVALEDLAMGGRRRREAKLRRVLDFLGLDEARRVRRFMLRRMSSERANVGRWRKGISVRRRRALEREYGAVVAGLVRDDVSGRKALRRSYEHSLRESAREAGRGAREGASLG